MGANDAGPASSPSSHRRRVGRTSSDNSEGPRRRLRWPVGLRWWELLPETVLALGLGFFFVTERSAAISAFKSRTAVTLMLAVAVGWLVVRLVLLRWAPWPALRFVVFAVGAILVLKVVVLPAYDDTTVVEALPTNGLASPAAPIPSTATANSAGAPVVESSSVTGGAATTTDSHVAPPTSSPPTTSAPGAPQPVAAAPLHGIDHRATGTARVYEQASGQLLIGLEDIDIQPGPDYDLYVVPGPDAEDVDHGIRLDDLRGNKGTQYYPVPDGTGFASGGWTVLVWCQVFDVPVAAATPV